MDPILSEPSEPERRQIGFWSVLAELGEEQLEEEVPTDAETLEEDCPFDEEEHQLLEKRRELKALLIASRQRADALASAIDAQVDEVMGKEKQRMQVIEELSQHCAELQRIQEQRQQELLQELEKLNNATQQCSECENRSQFLVERIITLLASSPLDAEHVAVLKSKHQGEREMLRQFEDIRQQYDEVRQQNVELTSRLLEESSFSRRLSDQLAEAEERFNRCAQDGLQPQPGGAAPGCQDTESGSAQSPATLHLNSVPPLPLRCEVDEGDRVNRHADEPGRAARMRRLPNSLGVLAEAEGTRSIPSSFTEKELLKESVKCPVSDLVALGTSCSCEGTDCGEGKYCFGEKPTCQDKPRQDPSLLDWHGKTAKGPHDGKDKGQIAGREFKFYKKSEKSGLRLFYSDNLRVYCHSQPSGASSWEIMIDGQPCPSGGIYGAYHVHRIENPHRINGWGGYCKGVGKGEHTVSVHVRPTPGYEAAYRHDAFTGWQGWGSGGASWHLEAQEVPEDYPFYHYVEGRLADGRDGGVVNGRVLNFNKQLADSRLRLFYSDNLRIHGRPHKSGACRWHLRIDGQMCGSGAITGDVYGHAPDNVHRQRSFMGYCDNVPAGQHKVDVHIEAIHHHWVCDAFTGWNS
ncbi:unnamed protein product [Durusdinium trenchii]|uniref:CTHRC1 C-terminal domain-containing protein n=1 Tax=Durusdinium trenchii TaxID=1381693 RepID=A0ABP0MHX7_9DINO